MRRKKKIVIPAVAVLLLLAAGFFYINDISHSRESMQTEDRIATDPQMSQKKEGKMTYKQITQQEAKEIMETEEGIIILDVRTREEYETGHIKKSVCLPNEEISGEPEELPDKAQKILVYCRSGNRSRQAAQKLADMGYENILEFGGIMDWPYPELVE